MKSFRQIILDEYFEPVLGKATRSTLALVLPLTWGILTNHVDAGVWISITAQLLSNITMRGGWSIRIMIIAWGTVSAAFCAYLGMLLGNQWYWSALGMMVLAFIGGFVRQSGDHGPGLVVAVLLMYLLSMDSPGGIPEANKMLVWMLGGGGVAIVFILMAWPFIPFSPFRRSVALTWKALSDWFDAFARKPEGNEEDVNDLDEKELALREALTQSMETISRKQAVAHARQNRLSYHLVELRRISSLLGASISSLHVAGEAARQEASFPDNLFHPVLENLSQTTHRIALAIISNRHEDAYIARLHLERVRMALDLFLKNDNATSGQSLPDNLLTALGQIMEYLKEAMMLLEKSMSGTDNLYISMRNFFTGITIPQNIPWVRFEFSSASFVFRFSLRLALAMGIGVAVYKYFAIPHGYWIAMTVMIVLQPEFGATFSKAFNRMKGTILGAVTGSLLLMLSLPLWVNLCLVTVCSFLMVYYLLRNYAVAAFFITMMVIALFHLLAPITWELAGVRVLNTVAGCALAMLGGYAFWPLWERYRTPAALGEALKKNSRYLEELLYVLKNGKHPAQEYFIRLRREAEIANNNAFNSLRRMKQEPQHKQFRLQQYYALTGRMLRIGRLLNMLAAEVQTLPGDADIPRIDEYGAAILPAFIQLEEIILSGESYTGDAPRLTEIIKRKPGKNSATDTKNKPGEQAVIEYLGKLATELSGMYYLLSEHREEDHQRVMPYH